MDIGLLHNIYDILLTFAQPNSRPSYHLPKSFPDTYEYLDCLRNILHCRLHNIVKSETFSKINLDFNHPVVELGWVLVESDSIDNNDWFNYTGIKDWKREHKNHAEWQGKSTGEIQKVEGGYAFYASFKAWVNWQIESRKGRKELVERIFPARKAPFKYNFGTGDN